MTFSDASETEGFYRSWQFWLRFIAIGFIFLLIFGALIYSEKRADAAVSNGDKTTWKQVAAGRDHTCAISQSGKIFCWGDNEDGQLGDGTTQSSAVPVQVLQGETPANSTALSVTTGWALSCAIMSDNKAYCWGFGEEGELGSGSNSSSTTPVAVAQGDMPTGGMVRQISSGESHTCVVAFDNRAYCWGGGGVGQLGDGATLLSMNPSAVSQGAMPSDRTVRQISAGGQHTCAIASDNRAYCWGEGDYGRLGRGSTTDSSTPVAVSQGAMPSGQMVREVSAGGEHTCAIASDNRSYCWGGGGDGELGDGQKVDRTTPVSSLQGAMPSGAIVRSISAGVNFTCAIASSNNTYCWGYGWNGELGNGGSDDQVTPVILSQGSMPSDAAVQQVSASREHGCVVLSTGRTFCWGRASDGKLGNGNSSDDILMASEVFSEVGLIPLYQSTYRAYGPSSSATPGSPLASANTAAELPDIADEFRVRVGLTNMYSSDSESIDSMSTWYNHSCVVGQDRWAYCWGSGANNVLGNGSTSNRSSPTAISQGQIPNGVTIQQVATGQETTCVLGSDYKAYCWGRGNLGQVGDGSTSDRSTPVAVQMPSGVTFLSISLGWGHSCALGSNYRVYCWGQNDDGAVGTGATTVIYNTPTQVVLGAMPTGSTVRQVEAGPYHVCAVASDNRAYCWGDNDGGYLGNGNTGTDQRAPVLVSQGAMPSNRLVQQVGGGDYHSCALGQDYRAYCWGNNGNRQLGDGTTGSSNTPRQVVQGSIPSGQTLQKISVGMDHNCAVASDGRAYCWGENSNRQLADGSTTDRNSPVAVAQGDMPAGQIVRQVTAAYLHTCAVASNGKVYCWGSNSGNRLGDGTTTDRNNPTVIANGELEWSDSTIGANKLSLQLQVAPLGGAGVCSAVSSGWQLVDSNSPIAWGSAPPSHGTLISSFGSDPTNPGPGSYTYQQVVQSGNFTNSSAINPGQTGLWDFVLKDQTSTAATDYCLRVASVSAGTAIDNYTVYPSIKTAPGSMTVRFVDDTGSPISGSGTNTLFGEQFTVSNVQISTANLTNSLTKQLEVHNSMSSSGWSVSLAATDGQSAKWESALSSYAYNASTQAAGQLSVDMTGASRVAVGSAPNGSACSPTTGVSLGSGVATYSSSVSSITLLTGSPSSQFNCTWLLRNIVLSQSIPPNQDPGSYTLDMTATVVAQ